jgi:hypothetical protein
MSGHLEARYRHKIRTRSSAFFTCFTEAALCSHDVGFFDDGCERPGTRSRRLDHPDTLFKDHFELLVVASPATGWE